MCSTLVINTFLISMIFWGCNLHTNHLDLLTSYDIPLLTTTLRAKVTCHGGSRTEDLQAATESAKGQAELWPRKSFYILNFIFAYVSIICFSSTHDTKYQKILFNIFVDD